MLFGAGKSATILIDYLIANAEKENWHATIADAQLEVIEQKTNKHQSTTAVALDINDADKRSKLIEEADIVISMMPPSLHYLIALDCLAANKNLLTASYIDDKLKALAPQIESKGLLFLCEMGLDPGIDHMSAMQIIDELKAKGAKITSFKSHCGGLVAPESNNNPWAYKISWNPKNIILAGKAGAVYEQDGALVKETYEQLFNPNRTVFFDDEIGALSYYPNRDSLSYKSLYGLESTETFIRTTLRYPTFMQGWQQIVAHSITDENEIFDTETLSIAAFWAKYIQPEALSSDELKSQFENFGLNDSSILNIGLKTAAEVLQHIAEQKLKLESNDKDLVVMLHEFEYEINGEKKQIRSALKVIGQDSLHTAMAKTVSLPLGIAAKLLLNGSIKAKGLQIPIAKEIYEPVLFNLAKEGIVFVEG